MPLDYKTAYHNFEAELEELRSQREALAGQIKTIEDRMTSVAVILTELGPYVGVEQDVQSLIDFTPQREADFEITRTVRDVLRRARRELTVPEIKAALESKGWDAGKYGNALATIHTVLKRLIKGDEVENVGDEGKPRYRHIEPAQQCERAGPDIINQLCCEALRKAGRPMPGPELRQVLIQAGIDVKAYGRPLVAIHQALRTDTAIRSYRERYRNEMRTFYEIVEPEEEKKKAVGAAPSRTVKR